MAGEKCPHCGKFEWWLDKRFPDKKFRYVYKISYCNVCHWQFVERAKLHLVNAKGKILEDFRNRPPSEYNLFVKEQVEKGKNFAEAAKLWNSQQPTKIVEAKT